MQILIFLKLLYICLISISLFYSTLIHNENLPTQLSKNNIKKQMHCSINTIVCDLHGVLFINNQPKFFIAKQIGLFSLLAYGLQFGKKMFYLKQMAFTILNKMKPSLDNESSALDPEAERLPLLMQEWLAGKRNGKDTIKLVHFLSDQHPEFFKSTIEKKLFLKIITIMFNPSIFVRMQTLHPDAPVFIKKLKKSGFKLYILSNWDEQSFNILKKKYKDFFELFDGITISGDIGYNKPHSDAYYAFFEQHQLNPLRCFFIDDQAINVKAAAYCGMDGIVCPMKQKGVANLKHALSSIKNLSKESH